MISSHVPNRELCEELKRLGYPQETEFSWVKEDGRSFGLAVYLKTENVFLPESDMYADNRRLFIANVAAPLVSEMAVFMVEKILGVPEYFAIMKKWRVWIPAPINKWEYFDSMPDAFAVQCIEILKAKEKI